MGGGRGGVKLTSNSLDKACAFQNIFQEHSTHKTSFSCLFPSLQSVSGTDIYAYDSCIC